MGKWTLWIKKFMLELYATASDFGGLAEALGWVHNLGGLSEGEGHTATASAGGLSVWTFTGVRGGLEESFTGLSGNHGGIGV